MTFLDPLLCEVDLAHADREAAAQRLERARRVCAASYLHGLFLERFERRLEA